MSKEIDALIEKLEMGISLYEPREVFPDIVEASLAEQASKGNFEAAYELVSRKTKVFKVESIGILKEKSVWVSTFPDGFDGERYMNNSQKSDLTMAANVLISLLKNMKEYQRNG